MLAGHDDHGHGAAPDRFQFQQNVGTDAIFETIIQDQQIGCIGATRGAQALLTAVAQRHPAAPTFEHCSRGLAYIAVIIDAPDPASVQSAIRDRSEFDGLMKHRGFATWHFYRKHAAEAHPGTHPDVVVEQLGDGTDNCEPETGTALDTGLLGVEAAKFLKNLLGLVASDAASGVPDLDAIRGAPAPHTQYYF